MMLLKAALKIAEDQNNKRWIRYLGEDYLNEEDAKQLKRAAERLAKEVRNDRSKSKT